MFAEMLGNHHSCMQRKPESCFHAFPQLWNPKD